MDRISDAWLRSEVHDVGEAVLGHQRRQPLVVAEVKLHDVDGARALLEVRRARALELYRVVSVEVVEADRVYAHGAELDREVLRRGGGGVG